MLLPSLSLVLWISSLTSAATIDRSSYDSRIEVEANRLKIRPIFPARGKLESFLWLRDEWKFFIVYLAPLRWTLLKSGAGANLHYSIPSHLGTRYDFQKMILVNCGSIRPYSTALRNLKFVPTMRLITVYAGKMKATSRSSESTTIVKCTKWMRSRINHCRQLSLWMGCICTEVPRWCTKGGLLKKRLSITRHTYV